MQRDMGRAEQIVRAYSDYFNDPEYMSNRHFRTDTLDWSWLKR